MKTFIRLTPASEKDYSYLDRFAQFLACIPEFQSTCGARPTVERVSVESDWIELIVEAETAINHVHIQKHFSEPLFGIGWGVSDPAERRVFTTLF